MRDARDREKELILLLRGKAVVSEVGKQIIDLCTLRMQRNVEQLVKEESAVVRGRAQELRDLLKILTEVGG